MRISRYDYNELKDRAVSASATQEDTNALGEWFERYGETFWNGEFYDVDGEHQLSPIDIENASGDFHRKGWELR